MVLLSSSIPLLIFCVDVLSIAERRFLKSLSIIVGLSISFCISQVLLHIIWPCCLVHTDLGFLCLLVDASFIIILCPSLCLVILFALKYILFDNLSILDFLWLIFSWYIFLYPFTLNLPILWYLKFVFCKLHIDGSCF